MILLVVGTLMAPGVHAIAKTLGGSLSAGEISLARFAFQFIFLLPLVLMARSGISRPSASFALRGLLLVGTTLSFFWALTLMPLANATAIFFVEPLILTLISALFMGEGIGWRRLMAVGAGFIGAMLVIRPSFEAAGVAALLPVVTALCYAVYVAMTRHVASGETALSAQFWVSIFASLWMSLTLVAGHVASVDVLRLTMPTPREAALLAAMGLVGVIGHRLAIEGYRRVPASILAPLQYCEIVGSIALGALVFGHLPDAMSALGTGVIIASGLYVFHRERIVSRRQG